MEDITAILAPRLSLHHINTPFKESKLRRDHSNKDWDWSPLCIDISRCGLYISFIFTLVPGHKTAIQLIHCFNYTPMGIAIKINNTNTITTTTANNTRKEYVYLICNNNNNNGNSNKNNTNTTTTTSTTTTTITTSTTYNNINNPHLIDT
jgi:hypothetical protein